MFKEECGSKSMTDFVGLLPMSYAYKMDDGAATRRAKGVAKTTIKRNITFDDYKRCLHTQQVYKSMNIMRSHHHQIYTQEINKVALSAKDTKRHILPDGISILAHGHYRIHKCMSKVSVHHIDLPNKALSNRQLEKAVGALRIPHFRGVFMRDALPSSPHPVECGILNHDDSDGSGTHWTCWQKSRGSKEYIDPYGLPSPEEMVEYLQPEIRYSTDENQRRGTVGWCVAIFASMC